MNMCDINNVNDVFKKVEPKLFLIALHLELIHLKKYRPYSQTNYLSLIEIFETLKYHDIAYSCRKFIRIWIKFYVSIWGLSSIPNSQYAISKAAASNAITFYGKIKKFPVVNLRLYSVYGPYEDSSRLMPVLCEKALEKSLQFADKEVSRDFIYVVVLMLIHLL